MKVILWLASKLLIGNLKRAIFPYIGATAGVASLIIAFSIGAGGEKVISNNLMAMGDNRIMLGGVSFIQRDIKILENYPFVEYAIFPEARVSSDENIFIGYPQRALNKLKLPVLKEREVVIDRNQFPDKKVGDILQLKIDERIYNFLVVALYTEENPFELMKQGNRIIISQEYFEQLFSRYSYDRVIVSFYQDEDAEELIPILLKKFKIDRGSLEDIKILETPEVYKRVIKIQKMVKNTLYTLATVSLVVSGLGIMTLISSGIRARTNHIGILRAVGMSRESVVNIFMAEGLIISLLGTGSGVILGVFGAILCGKLIMIPPIFIITKIVLAIILALLVGIGGGIYPARKAGSMNITDTLREG